MFLLVAPPLLQAGARLDTLKSFGLTGMSGSEPLTALLEGSDGKLYGTTSKGGPGNAATLFRLDRDGSNYRVLLWLPGATAVSALAEGADGQLYGVKTATLGTNAADTTYGTIFKIGKDGAGFSALHTFVKDQTATEGSGPRGGLLVVNDGTLYGTASSGGPSNCGTIFRLKNDGSGFAVLNFFKGQGAGDGSGPRAALLQASDGRLYGTTYSGGTGGYGTIFRIKTDGSEYSVLQHLSYGTDVPINPDSPLLEGAEGVLYGSTGNVVYKLNKDGTGLSVLLSAVAPKGVVMGRDGKLYGTSLLGGDTNAGAVFSMRADGSEFTALHSFLQLNYNYLTPAAPIQGRDGVLFGVNRYGGLAQVGEVFRVNTNGTGYASLHNFSESGGDGQNPVADLIRGSDGDFYGTTTYGGAYDDGTVFKVRRDGSSAVLYDFGANADDGYGPGAALLEATDGALYGTTAYGGGGLYDSGTLFKLNTDGSGYAVLYRFVGSPSVRWQPSAGLLEGQDGWLYGTTLSGGATNAGTVFKLAKNGSGFTVLHSFMGSANGDGATPSGRLVQTGDGFLYGCTTFGSTTPISPSDQGHGTIFKLSTNGGDCTVLHSFDYYGGDAARPMEVFEGSDGLLYGITAGLNVAGGTSNTNIAGVVFSLNKDGSGYSILHAFGVSTNDGENPSYLIEAGDGSLYGATIAGGTNRAGTIFRLHKDGSDYESMVSLALGPNVAIRPIGLTRGVDGAFYGVTLFGGEMNFGTVFRFLSPEFPQLLGVTPGLVPTINLAGGPGLDYELLRSSDLVNWAVLARLTMPASGTSAYPDTTAPRTAAFYRLRRL